MSEAETLLKSPKRLERLPLASLRTQLIWETGSLGERQAWQQGEIGTIGELLEGSIGVPNHPEKAAYFCGWLARECLLGLSFPAHPDPTQLLKRLPCELRATCPFGGPLTLEAILKAPKRLSCSAALFPLASLEGGEASVGVEWAYHDDAAVVRHWTDQPEEGLCGESNTLAQGLVKLASQRSAAGELRRNLAVEWIVSGVLRPERDEVGKVELGNKAQLAQRFPLKSRKWLLPEENYRELGTLPSTTRYAGNLNTALAHISGVGVGEASSVAWPQEPPMLHQLVGGNPAVNIATPCLFAVGSVCLWYSAQSEAKMKLIDAVLSGDLAVSARRMDSASMIQAERELEAQLGDELAKGGQVVFNVTSGNRLMSYAVQSMASRYPNVWLIYKDIDQNSHYTLIRYLNGVPFTGVLPIPDEPYLSAYPHVDCLLKKDTRVPETAAGVRSLMATGDVERYKT